MQPRRLKASTKLKIMKSPDAVFDAIVNPEVMAEYFISSGDAQMTEGRSVEWKFDDVGAQLTIDVKALEPDKQIIYAWSASGSRTTVQIDLEDSDGASSTVLSVTEDGWEFDEEGVEKLIEQTQGWVHMFCCMKAYLEYGVHLRKGGSIGKPD